MNLPQSKIIEQITKEVEQLHPLLKALLPKMPRITNMDYTHGSSEKGADFVLCRTDDAFSTEEYIGIIAKIGKITSDLTDIERQVDECSMPRFVFGGKKKVYLSEIWVMTTGHISSNAQEKIQHKYKSTNLKFVAGQKLSELVERYLPNYGTPIPLNVGELLIRTTTAIIEQDRRLSLIPNAEKDFEIEQDVYPHTPFEYRKKRKHLPPTNIVRAIADHRALLVEGSMGSGKSKLLRTAAKFFGKAENYIKYKFFPILISFRDFVENHNCDCEALLSARIGSSTLSEFENDNQFLILVDGVDEKQAPLSELLGHLRTLFTTVGNAEHLRLVVTSRYLGEYEKNQTILSGATRMELRALTMNRVIQFIEAICSGFRKDSRIVQDLRKSSLFKELPRSPIAAILLARLMQDSSKELPSNMTELYAKYTELLLGRWDIEKGLQSQKEYEALDSILTKIAEYMLTNTLIAMSIAEAREIANNYLSRRNLGVSTQDVFGRLMERCEIVCLDEEKNILYFKHRTFAEFFYAKSLLKKTPLIDSRVFQVYWMNTFFFYTGLQRDCPELLRAIASVKPENENQRWLKIINMPMYLLAGYLTEFEVLKECLCEMVVEMASFYHEIVTNRIESQLAVFPQMTLLCLMQGLMRQSYSYEFFKPAFEEIALQIDESVHDPNITAVSLFLLGVINREVDSKNAHSFDFLLERHLKSLSLDLQLAIRHETASQMKRTPLLRLLDKKTARIMDIGFVQRDRKLKDTQFLHARRDAVSSAIDDLYEKPIKILKIT